VSIRLTDAALDSPTWSAAVLAVTRAIVIIIVVVRPVADINIQRGGRKNARNTDGAEHA